MLIFRYNSADAQVIGKNGIIDAKTPPTGEDVITTGMRGKQVVLEFSPEWEGLAKTVVFSNGEKTRDVVFGGNPVTIPAEILEEPLKKLTVGVYGVGDRGEVVIPTVRALGPVILPGALPSGEAAAEPVIPLWEQIHAQLGDLSQLDTETKESLVAAINEILEKYGKIMSPDKTLTQEGMAADAKAVGDALRQYFRDFKGIFPVTASDEEASHSAGEILAAAEVGMLPVLYAVHADGAFFAPLFRFREETALFEVPGMEAGTATLMTFAVDEEKRVTVTVDYQTNSGAEQGPAGVIGAVGDGVADDTLAFRAALAGNRVVYVPGGTYKLSGELVIGDNCCLELSQDAVLEFTQTSGNCITLGMLSTLKGNHATVKVPYAFDGHVLHAYSNDHTDAEAQAVQPWSKWDPLWKSGRYVSDLNICKADSRGFHYAVNPEDCKGTAVYISADNTAGMLTFMWGIHYSGLRIAGAFACGIHAQNFDGGWVHEMRIDAFIDACETGVCLEDCNNTYISATVQPRRAYTLDQTYIPYAKHGIKLVRSRNTDLSGSRVWDWNATNTLWKQDNEYQHIAMYADCSGTILNDFVYHSQGDTRKRIYTDNDHNLETVTILQEPVDRWFKVIGGEPYYTDGLTNQRLLREDALDAFVDVDFVKNFTDVLATATEADGVTVFNEIGYQVGKRFTSLGTGTDLADSTYYMTTGFIRVPLGSTIYGRGLHFDDTAKSYAGIVYYNANRQRVASMAIANVVQGNQYYVLNYKRTSDGFSVQIPSSVTLSNLNATYVRLVFPMTCVGEFPMLSIDEEIRYTMEGFLADGVKVKGENVIGTPGQTTPDWVATKEAAGGDEVVVPEQAVSGGKWTNLQTGMQPDLLYDVTINGEVYACVARADGSGVQLGNNTSLTLNDYPFCIYWAGGTATGGMFFKNSSISSPVTLKVTDHAGYVYDKMPEGYLPDCVVKSVNGKAPDAQGNVEIGTGGGGSAGIDVTAEVGQTIVVEEVDATGKPTRWKATEQPLVTTEIIPQTTYTAEYSEDYGCFMWVFENDTKLIVGEKYTVWFDGVKYTCTAKSGTLGGMSLVYIGNDVVLGNNTGEPFALASIDVNEGYVFLMGFDGNEHTVRLAQITLSDNYVPQSVYPYYIDVTGSGTEEDPYVCNDTVSNVEAKYRSGRPVVVKLKQATYSGSDVIAFYATYVASLVTVVEPAEDIANTSFSPYGLTFAFYFPFHVGSSTTSGKMIHLLADEKGTYYVTDELGG